MNNVHLFTPRSQEEDEEELFLALANEVYRTHHPNPQQRVCPDQQRLRAAAFHQFDAQTKEVMIHVTKCSPCSEAFGRLCQEYRKSQNRRLPWLMKIAALLFVVPGVSLWVWIRHVQTPSSPASMAVVSQDFHGQTTPPQASTFSQPLEMASAEGEAVKLDLAGQLVLRGARAPRSTPSGPPLELGRKLLALTIVLPPGNEPGRYELRLENEQSHLRATGEARLVDRATVLEVAIDTTNFSAGPCQLGIRQAGWQWSNFTVTVK
jgi:hypothetical protein